jgi:hypothetical protein
MLRKTSAAVRMYLERAADAHEEALASVDPKTRHFYLMMESKWMDLAASTALVERVDLFLQSREFRLRLPTSDLCADCHERMSLKGVHSTFAFEDHIFECLNCGFTHMRRIRTDGLQD